MFFKNNKTRTIATSRQKFTTVPCRHCLFKNFELRTLHPCYERFALAEKTHVHGFRAFDKRYHLPRSMNGMRHLRYHIMGACCKNDCETRVVTYLKNRVEGKESTTRR